MQDNQLHIETGEEAVEMIRALMDQFELTYSVSGIDEIDHIENVRVEIVEKD